MTFEPMAGSARRRNSNDNLMGRFMVVARRGLGAFFAQEKVAGKRTTIRYTLSGSKVIVLYREGLNGVSPVPRTGSVTAENQFFFGRRITRLETCPGAQSCAVSSEY